ncbi:MAG: hypothetical protein N2067_02075 [Spirochaetaceae bacterium]|nr:hypothetical protein [Spirochaetaceae bacterium]
MTISLMLAWLCCVAPISEAQEISGLQPVLEYRTRFFSLYYPRHLQPQAARLATFADAMAETLSEAFDLAPETQRVPVLLTDRTFGLNGYSTTYPSRRIVLKLDAATPDDQLASFGDELAAVFLHELVHDRTLSIRGSLWRLLAVLLGDSVAPAGLVMPSSLVEGTAVWAESRLLAKAMGRVQPEAGQPAIEEFYRTMGRLQDPAALVTVTLDRLQAVSRGFWDISGLADWPGSGSLPYLYGGLYVEYLVRTYGWEKFALLWKRAGAVRIFETFDRHGFLVRGIVEDVYGMPTAALWQQFLTWLDSEFMKPALQEAQEKEIHFPSADKEQKGSIEEAIRPIRLPARHIGAFAAIGERLVYVDLDRGGMYAVPIASAARGDVQPVRLFAADGNLSHISENENGFSFEWVQGSADGSYQAVQAQYAWDTGKTEVIAPLEKGALSELGMLSGHLFYPWMDQVTETRYGLLRIGSEIVLAREKPDGRREILRLPLTVRWLSPGIQSAAALEAGREGIFLRFALGLIAPSGLPTLGVLEIAHDSSQQKELSTAIYLARGAFRGGAFEPVFAGEDTLIVLSVKAGLGAPEHSLYLLAFEPLNRRHWETGQARWEPLEQSNASRQQGVAYRAAGLDGLNVDKPARSVLFPAWYRTQRLPYVELGSVSVGLAAQDLTGRLAWQTELGWNLAAGRPLAAWSAQLAVDAWTFLAGVQDRPLGSAGTTPARIMGLTAGIQNVQRCMPIRRSLSFSLLGMASFYDTDYQPAEIFNPSFDATRWAGALKLEFSDQRSSRLPPYGTTGMSVALHALGELAGRGGEWPGLGAGISWRFESRGGGALVGWAMMAPAQGMLFGPSGIWIKTMDGMQRSILSAPGSLYMEYADPSLMAPWYVQADISQLLGNWEIRRAGVIAQWLGIRRANLRVGARSAVLAGSGTPMMLASVYARGEVDAAWLTGLAASLHVGLAAEASVRLTSLPGIPQAIAWALGVNIR